MSRRSSLPPIVSVLLALTLLPTSPTAQAIEVEAKALLPGMAVVVIDGKRRTLKQGQTSPEGVKLLSADSKAAVVEVDGKSRRLELGASGSLGGGFTTPEQAEVRLYPDTSGMYRTHGSINGMPVEFLVDTGATTIAMNSTVARQLGVDYRYKGKPIGVQTASRMERAWMVNLDTVKVGDVSLHNVEASVLEGDFPAMTLLGMSFLGRLDMRHDGQAMVLRTKF